MAPVSSQTKDHFDWLLNEKSIKIIEDSHNHPKLDQNLEVNHLRWPKLGHLSSLKPMIEENKSSVIERLGPDKREISLGQSKDSHDIFKNTKSFVLNEFQLELYSLLRTYKDILYPNESYELFDEIQQVYVIHIIKHLMNSRSRIIANNKVFDKKTLSDSIINDDPTLRDQGFTRPRILFLLPFRYSALKLGKCISKVLGEKNVINLDRFIEEYGDEDGVDSTSRPIGSNGNKPNDYYHTFHGNTNDAFLIGVKLSKMKAKFFCDFYHSDIIIASPLGLKTKLTPDEHQEPAVDDSEQIPLDCDADYLSSIEIVILDQSEVFLMQNWEHIIDVMRNINLMPKKPRSMDVSRVRAWNLENWSKYYRQLIMLTSISAPLIRSFFQIYALNYEGCVTIKHREGEPQAKHFTSMCSQHFLYYDSPSAKEACDNRFTYFTRCVLPKFMGTAKCKLNPEPIGHTMIFVSSYFDFVRLRNYFRREKLSFTQICEYTEENKVSKAKQLFYYGARQFLLYTERCHFYHRYKIKGIRNMIFYEPPTFTKFYTEMLDMLRPEMQGKKFVGGPKNFTVTTLFSNHCALQLGSLIGHSNATKLIQNKRSML